MAASLGTINKSYVSALDPLLDTREINKLITDVQNEVELSDILINTNKKMPTKQPVYYTFYDDQLIKSITVTADTGTGTTVVTPALSAGTSGYTRVNDMVLFTNNVVGIVTAVSSSSGVDTLTIEAVAGANITLGATDTLSLFSRAVGVDSCPILPSALTVVAEVSVGVGCAAASVISNFSSVWENVESPAIFKV